MKRFIALISVIMLLSVTVPSYGDTMLRKLGRGSANVLTCPYEVFYRIQETNNEEGPFAAVTWGLINGIMRTCVRGVVGVYEIATFPIPFPPDYEPIITDPEFFLQEGAF